MIPDNFPLLLQIKSWLTPRNVLLFERIIGFFGLVVACWLVYKLGPSRIAANLHRISWGFFILAGLKSLEFIFEAFAWKLIAGEEGNKIPFKQSFLATLEGNALNYITLTHLGGESLKAVAFRNRIGLTRSAASAIVMKFCTLISFWLVISIGFLVILYAADITGETKVVIGIGIFIMTLLILSASWFQTVGFFGPFARLIEKFLTPMEWIKDLIVRLTHLDTLVIDTYRLKPWKVSMAVILCCLVWMEEIFFVWLGLYFLNLAQSGTSVIIAATIALLLNRFLFFVPWRAGTQEGTMVLSFTVLGLSEPVGLSIAILKRLRELLWVFIGLSAFAVESIKNSPPGKT